MLDKKQKMRNFPNALLNNLPNYEFDFKNHDSDNSGLIYFELNTINKFWEWCEDNDLLLLGFCKTPQYKSDMGVGLMFENTKSFDKYWFHVPPESYCSIVRTLFGKKVLAKIWL